MRQTGIFHHHAIFTCTVVTVDGFQIDENMYYIVDPMILTTIYCVGKLCKIVNFVQYNTIQIQHNTWLVRCPAYNENGTARHTVLIKDKSQLKRNVEQIGFHFQPALITSKSLSRSDRLGQTVPYCRTGNSRLGLQTQFLSVEQCSLATGRTKTYWVAADWLNGFAQIHGTTIVMYYEVNCNIKSAALYSCTGCVEQPATSRTPSAPDGHDRAVTDQV